MLHDDVTLRAIGQLVDTAVDRCNLMALDGWVDRQSPMPLGWVRFYDDLDAVADILQARKRRHPTQRFYRNMSDEALYGRSPLEQAAQRRQTVVHRDGEW